MFSNEYLIIFTGVLISVAFLTQIIISAMTRTKSPDAVSNDSVEPNECSNLEKENLEVSKLNLDLCNIIKNKNNEIETLTSLLKDSKANEKELVDKLSERIDTVGTLRDQIRELDINIKSMIASKQVYIDELTRLLSNSNAELEVARRNETELKARLNALEETCGVMLETKDNEMEVLKTSSEEKIGKMHLFLSEYQDNSAKILRISDILSSTSNKRMAQKLKEIYDVINEDEDDDDDDDDDDSDYVPSDDE